MARFGRQSEKEKLRSQKIADWFTVVTPLGPVSTGLGMMAVVDMITMVLGIPLGIAAVTTGYLGLKKIQDSESSDEDTLKGRPWCKAGIILGCIGITLSVIVPLYILNLVD